MGLRNLLRERRGYLENQKRAVELVMMRAEDHRLLEKRDFIQAAHLAKVPPANLKAFHSVESRGRPFDAQGRLEMNYEPHKVHKYTKGTLAGVKVPAYWNGREVEVPLSYPSWRRNPKGLAEFHHYDLDPESRWQMLVEAYRRHPGALRGISIGSFQVMTFHAEKLGYRSPLDMVREHYKGEKYHLAGAMRYLRMVEAFEDLRRGRWAVLARKFNGTGQVAYYADKLSDASRMAAGEFETGTRRLT